VFCYISAGCGLHASGVVIGDRVWFHRRQGLGKIHQRRQPAQRGHDLISDELLVVRFDDQVKPR